MLSFIHNPDLKDQIDKYLNGPSESTWYEKLYGWFFPAPQPDGWFADMLSRFMDLSAADYDGDGLVSNVEALQALQENMKPDPRFLMTFLSDLKPDCDIDADCYLGDFESLGETVYVALPYVAIPASLACLAYGYKKLSASSTTLKNEQNDAPVAEERATATTY